MALYSEIRDSITHALLMGSPILEQSLQHLRILHPVAGLTLLELQEGEPARSSSPLFKAPRLNHATKGFPLKIMHEAFSLPPVGVVNEMRLTPLLAQVPSFFDQYEVGHAGQAKVCEFKCKERNKMPVNIYKMGLALGVSRTWRDTLLEQLLGTREEPEPFELTTPEEPIARPSIRERLLSGVVA